MKLFFVLHSQKRKYILVCLKKKKSDPKHSTGFPHELTFLATKSTIIKAARKHPAAILAVRRFVDASIKSIPQNDEPRSEQKREIKNRQKQIQM